MPDSVGSRERDLAVTTDRGGSSHHTQGSAFELFRNGEGDAFVDMDVDGHRETHPVSSKAFRHWLNLKGFDHTGKLPAAAELKRQTELLQAKAVQQETPVHEVHARAAFAAASAYVSRVFLVPAQPNERPYTLEKSK
jgi:hypothetical protein